MDNEFDNCMGKFPASLLNASEKERKLYFKQHIVDHPYIRDAVKSAYSLLDSLVSERLVFVCGPSGVGKSEFVKKFKEKIVSQDGVTNLNKPGMVPVVDVEASAPEKNSFDFDLLWMSILEQLREPLIDRKISYVERNITGINRSISIKRKPDYIRVVANALKYRGVKALIIDEAHHMLRISSGKRLNWSADILKTLVNLSGVPVILVGTYALLAYLEDLNPQITDQIGLRSKLIHIPRYHANIQDEQHNFGVCAKNLYLNMPFEKINRLFIETNWQYLYTYTLGRVGALKVWFMDAYSYALEKKAECLTLEHLERTQKPGHLCETELSNIRTGEERMRTVMSNGKLNEFPYQDDDDASYEENDEMNSMSEKTTSGNRKPFHKSPRRVRANEGLM